MKLNLANKFLILGILLYILAGIAVIGKMDYSVIILLAATVFLAFGFFANVRFRWDKLFKKKV
jgi:hypothetical protein